jgi:hypothetical protein
VRLIQCLIEQYHILEPNQEQVYFCLGLHKTPHYSIPALQLQQYKDRLVLNGVDLASKVTIYESDQSYVGNHRFLEVYNGNTPELERVEQEYHTTVDFRRIIDDCSGLEAFPCGSKQQNVGFSGLHLKIRDPVTSVVKPGKCDGTDEKIDVLLSLSLLGQKLNLFEKRQFNNEVNERLHSQSFANSIGASNELEGLTVGLADSDAQLLHCHCDVNNCSLPGHDFFIVASTIVLDVSNPSQPKFIRAVAIGYDRKTCSNYVNRVKESSPAVVDAQHYLESLPSYDGQKLPMEHKMIKTDTQIQIGKPCSLHSLIDILFLRTEPT